jgi:hypothetical protein
MTDLEVNISDAQLIDLFPNLPDQLGPPRCAHMCFQISHCVVLLPPIVRIGIVLVSAG